MDMMYAMNILTIKPESEYGTGATITVEGNGYKEIKSCTTASDLVFLIPGRPTTLSKGYYAIKSSKNSITKYVELGVGEHKTIRMSKDYLDMDEYSYLRMNDSTLTLARSGDTASIKHTNTNRALSYNGNQNTSGGNLSYGGTISIPRINTDAAGHVSGITNYQYKLPDAPPIKPYFYKGYTDGSFTVAANGETSLRLICEDNMLGILGWKYGTVNNDLCTNVSYEEDYIRVYIKNLSESKISTTLRVYYSYTSYDVNNGILEM